MKKAHKIVIEGELCDFNTYDKAARTHRNKAGSIKKSETDRVARECKKTPQKQEFSFPVDISFVWYCKNKKKDKDNIIFAKKFILDGIVKAGLLPNDGWRHIGNFEDIITIDSNRPRIEVFIL